MTLVIIVCISHAHDISLYQKIDTEKLECLNESEEGAGKTVFKAWEDRLDRDKVSVLQHARTMYTVTYDNALEQFVESDVDEELLFYVP